jgi:spermidine/putrescine transport system substrate-binding protein
MEQVTAALIACKPNFKFFYDNKDQLLNGIRSDELWAAAMWDTGGWTLNRENPDIQYIVPRSGALGWLDTFALPARARNLDAAYAWINFTMRPDNAARVIKSVGNFSAAQGTAPYVDPRLKEQFRAAFPEAQLKNVHWYPAIPPGLEEIEGRLLDRIKAAD